MKSLQNQQNQGTEFPRDHHIIKRGGGITTVLLLVRGTFILLMLLILYLNYFQAEKLSYPWKCTFPKSNLIYLIMGIFTVALLLVAMRAVKYWLPLRIKQKSDCIVLCISVGLILLQFYLILNYYFIGDWDPGELRKIVVAFVHNETFPVGSWEMNYLSYYPNNGFLLAIWTMLAKMEYRFGILDTQSCLLSMLAMNCVISSVTGWLLYRVLHRLTSRYWAWVGWIIYLSLIWISPWVSIPYTDSAGLLFPILILDIYTNEKKGTWWKLSALGIISALAYKIKPQAMIPFIAIVLLEVIDILSVKQDWIVRVRHLCFATRRKAVLGVVLMLTIMAVFSTLIGQIKADSSIEIDKERAFEFSHWMMMGVNPVSYGTYSDEDVQFSMGIATQEERRLRNLEVFVERMSDFTPLSYLNFLKTKLIILYHDGSFGWWKEGSFLVSVSDSPNWFLSPLLRNFYYATGDYYSYFLSWMQMLWMVILTLCPFAIFHNGNVRNNRTVTVIMLSVLGLTLFEMIFELRARYLYTMVPLYITLAVLGLHQIVLLAKWLSVHPEDIVHEEIKLNNSNKEFLTERREASNEC